MILFNQNLNSAFAGALPAGFFLMKRIALWLLVIGLTQNVFGQSSNKATHDCIDKAFNLLAVGQKFFHLKEVECHCCGYGAYVEGYDAQGNLSFSYGLGYGDINFLHKMIVTKQKSLVVYGHSRVACDITGSTSFIAELDTTGTIVFTTTLAVPQSFNGIIKDLVQHTDSSYYLVSDNDIYHYSNTGTFIGKANTGLTGINSITSLSNGNFLFNANSNGTLSNIITDTSLTIISQQTVNSNFGKFVETSQGVLYGLTNLGAIESYSLNGLTYINNTASTFSSPYSIKNFTIRNDSLFCIGYLNGSMMYAVLDGGFSSLYISTAPYKIIHPNSIALSGNTVGVLTTGYASVRPDIGYRSIYRFPLNGSFQSRYDIGVDSYTVTESSISFQSVNYMPLFKAQVTVKNYGTDTVNSFYLNHFAKSLWCIIPYHKLFELDIPPGDTVVINAEVYGNGVPHLPSSLEFMKQQNCFFTSIPNGENDINSTNDGYCDSVVFLLTGLELHEISNAINLFPNPFSERIEIEGSADMLNVTIVNSLGIEVDYFAGAMGKTLSIKTSDWEKGLYFVLIKTPEGNVRKKILKE